MSSHLRHELPTIAMSAADHHRLAELARLAAPQFPAAEFLAQEVERAEILSAPRPLDGLVQMGSRVRYRDDVTGQERAVILDYPEHADISAGRISVLTPVGAALVGLSVGQSIEWQTASGGLRSLTVLDVKGPL
jgi:regulator of nucleoside diphosphate kinase